MCKFDGDCIRLYLSIYILCSIVFFLLFFFFKQKTAYEMRISDWSSDVSLPIYIGTNDFTKIREIVGCAEYCPACEALATRTVPKITHDGLAGYPRATGFLASRAPRQHADRMRTVAAPCVGARVNHPLFARWLWSIPLWCLTKYHQGHPMRRLT